MLSENPQAFQWTRRHGSQASSALPESRDPASRLLRQVRHLSDQSRLECDGNRRRGDVGESAHNSGVLNVKCGCVSKALRRRTLNLRPLLLALREDLERFATDVHTGLVAIELVQLIEARLVLHCRIVDAEVAMKSSAYAAVTTTDSGVSNPCLCGLPAAAVTATGKLAPMRRSLPSKTCAPWSAMIPPAYSMRLRQL